MIKPKISFLIAAYKTPETLLRKTIDTLLNQTFQDFEILLLNEGADLDVKNIVFSYKSTVSVDYKENIDAKIRYGDFYKKSPYDFGFNQWKTYAQGEYVHFHDHDDTLYFEPNSNLALENMYNEAKSSDSDILIFNYKFGEQYTDNIKFKPIDINKNNLSNEEINELQKYFLGPLFPLWNKLYKREFLISNNLELNTNLRITIDDEFNLKSLFKTNKITFSNNYYYKYNNIQSSFTKKDFEFFNEDLKIIENLKKYYEDLHIYQYVKIAFINSIFSILFNHFQIHNAINSNKLFEIKQNLNKALKVLNITDEDIIELKNYKYANIESINALMFYL